MAGLRKVANYLSALMPESYSIPPQISGAVNYLVDSYFAKLDEIHSRRPVDNSPMDPYTHIQEIWLGCELHKAITIHREYPSYAMSLNAYAFWCLFYGNQSTYQIIPLVDAYPYKEMIQNRFRAHSRQISISLDEKLTLPVYGKYFIQCKGSGKKLFVNIDFCFDSFGCSITCVSNPEDQADAENFFAAFEASRIANDIYYKKCLSFVSGRLDFCRVTPTNWADIILKSDLKDLIQQNTVGILSNIDAFNKLGMCPNRNVLLISPPGMAKTTIFRAICGQVAEKMTCIWCTGKSIDGADDVTKMFEAARAMAPCLIMIEDMDLFGGERKLSSNSYVLNEFLACLDGQTENHGVVILASTNDFCSMDEALAARPGRFDNKIEIPFPDMEDRHLMLSSFLKHLHATPDKTVDKECWKTILEMTDGLTGAYIRDLAELVVIRCVHQGQTSGDGCVFSASDLIAAADAELKNYQLGQRVVRHHQPEARNS